jgi:hypothetical protein
VIDELRLTPCHRRDGKPHVITTALAVVSGD